MARKIVVPNDISFDDFSSKPSFDSLLETAANFLYAIPNPYHGGKRQIISGIFREIEAQGIEYESVLDLFCGSGAFGIMAMHLRKNVWVNDLMKYPCLGAYVFLDNEHDKEISQDLLKDLLFTANTETSNFVINNYNADNADSPQRRFNETECRTLDYFRANVRSLPTGQAHHALLTICHYVAERCYVGGRLNRGQIVAEYEHRINHKRNQKGNKMTFDPFYMRIYNDVFNTRKGIFAVTNEDAHVSLTCRMPGIRPDLCYIDPPYGGGQSDYATMYEFFEGYLREEKWPTQDDDLCKASRFSSAKGYKKHFESLLTFAREIPYLVFSFNNESWTTIDDIKSIISAHRSLVSVKKFSGIDYRMRNRTQPDRERSDEYVIIAK